VTDRPLVRVERRGTLGLLTMDRPDQRNPLDPDSAAALRDAMRGMFADDAVRSVGIAGAGDAFCAGGDLRQMGRFHDVPVEEALAWPAAIIDLHRMMLEAPKPVVAAVDGPAYAGGMGLAGMCDIVLATRRARFAMPEVTLGLFPMIIVAHLVRALPRKVMNEMVFSGRPIDAAEAHRVGFVNRLYDDRDGLFEGLDEYAETFARTSPAAVRLGRRALGLLADLPAGQALDAAAFLNLPFFLGGDLAEGAAAFLDKRPPRWHPEAT
jgi:enoyl-CoA hydratase/carnithine racemase